MTDTKIAQAIKSGVQAHQAGNIVEAEHYYTSIIAQQPKHPDANHKYKVNFFKQLPIRKDVDSLIGGGIY